MPKVIVTTDEGRAVWMIEDIEAWHVRGLECPTNQRGSAVASGVRRACEDAQAIQSGADPERPSEKVMRLLSAEKAEAAAPERSGRARRTIRRGGFHPESHDAWL